MTDLEQYIETALWSSTDHNDEPLDKNYSIDDIDAETLKRCQTDIDAFIAKAGNLLDDLNGPIMHDFWLTRNRHGAGFWDGDYPKEIGRKLTEISHSFGEIDFYVGDDGRLYL
jgi:hypothetical protein